MKYYSDLLYIDKEANEVEVWFISPSVASNRIKWQGGREPGNVAK